MAEVFALWGALGPVQTGISLFVLGVVVGSFCNVLRYRIPLGMSFVRGRSECPTCGHRLKARDLVPVLSYVLLRGRCRYCTLKIPATYPLTELTTGLLAALAGVMQGWGAGFLALGTWVAGTMAFALLERRRPLRDESGTTLVEVMVAVLLLTLAVGSAFEGIRAAHKASLAAQRRTQAVALARYYFADAASQIQEFAPPVLGTVSAVSPALGIPQPDGDFEILTGTAEVCAGCGLWTVTISVTCPKCPADLKASGKAYLIGEVRQ